MDIERSLQSLGLDEGESKLYMHALELGNFSVAEISLASGFKRPTCYLILDELAKRGLVTIVPQASKRTYAVESPDVFLTNAEKNILDIKKVLPDLYAIQKGAQHRPLIKFYPGQKGAQAVYNDILKESPKEYNYIGNIHETMSVISKDFLFDWADKRIKKKIRSIGVRVDTDYTKDLFTEDNTFRETRYAPKGTTLPYTLLLYSNKVGIVSTKKDGFGLIIESRDFRLTMRSLFDVLWSISTPFGQKDPTVLSKPQKRSA